MLRSIACPVLVIHGTEDRCQPVGRFNTVVRHTGAERIVLEGSGHLPMGRDPVVVNKAIRAFVDRVTGTPAPERRWARGPARPKRLLYLSSPIGLGAARPYPTGRSRQQQRRWLLRRRVDVEQPAGRSHHGHGAGQTTQPDEIGPATLAQPGIDHGGHRPLELPELGRDLVRRDHVVAEATQVTGDRLLVTGVEVGVEQADGDAVHAVGNGREGREVDGPELGPIGRQSAVHLEAEPPGNERFGPVGPLVVQAGPILAADLDHVAQALARHQRDDRQVALEHGIGGDRRPVGEEVGQRAVRTQQRGDAGRHRPVGRVRGGQDLAHCTGAVDEVGEGPAGVRADHHRVET